MKLRAGCARTSRTLVVIASLAVIAVLAPVVASATRISDPSGFQIQVPSDGLIVHESAGRAVITVFRAPSESGAGAQVRYITSGDGYNPDTDAPFDCGGTPCTATSFDFTSVKDELDFLPGQTSATFAVPITDHGTTSVAKTLRVALFGPSPIGLGSVSSATLTILNDDSFSPPTPGNPLGLPVAPTGDNPLAGARFFIDHESAVAKASRHDAALRAIAGQPGTARFGTFSYSSPYVPDIAVAVSRYLTRAAAQEPGTIPLLATYRLVHGVCGNGDSPQEERDYHDFITGFAQGIGSYPAVLFLEMDSLITSPCLNPRGLAVRTSELSDAINVLSATCPHVVVYLDAGAADALHAPQAARLLERAGVAQIQGFFLNATHFDWTSNEIRYGRKISRLIGGKHFVINTGENGRGPLRPMNIVKQGLEVLCNPVGRGLGPKPTTHTGYRGVDMFAWTTNPGESGGQCQDQPGYELAGAPPTGAYWPTYGVMLVRNADYRPR
ncbi:MAG: glycoside hydrolase family 6 protein [Solirubrobacterales bacterium]|nr:glycoside hydrolase family 6 protein [Solirubrobacterales bacterium]